MKTTDNSIIINSLPSFNTYIKKQVVNKMTDVLIFPVFI